MDIAVQTQSFMERARELSQKVARTSESLMQKVAKAGVITGMTGIFGGGAVAFAAVAMAIHGDTTVAQHANMTNLFLDGAGINFIGGAMAGVSALAYKVLNRGKVAETIRESRPAEPPQAVEDILKAASDLNEYRTLDIMESEFPEVYDKLELRIRSQMSNLPGVQMDQVHAAVEKNQQLREWLDDRGIKLEARQDLTVSGNVIRSANMELMEVTLLELGEERLEKLAQSLQGIVNDMSLPEFREFETALNEAPELKSWMESRGVPTSPEMRTVQTLVMPEEDSGRRPEHGQMSMGS